MSDLCKQVQERLPELVAKPDPEDPEEAALKPLREHLAACPSCKAEVTEWQYFFEMDREAEALETSEAEEQALRKRLEADRKKFLAMVEADLATVRSGQEGAGGVIERLRGWLVAFPPLQLPQRVPLAAAAEAGTERADLPERLLHATHDDPKALLELLLTSEGNRLFVTLDDPALSEGEVEVTLTLESGKKLSQRLAVKDRIATWELPGGLVLGGACAVEVRPV